MRSVPKFLHGQFRNVLKQALEEATWGNYRQDEARQERGWKLFVLLPRMLLHRDPGGGLISKTKLRARFEAFSRGEWSQLLRASAQCDEKAAVGRRRRRRRTSGDDVEQRAMRAEMLIQLGELSSARQALEGCEIALGTKQTLNALKDERRRPALPRAPLPNDVLEFEPDVLFQLDEKLFGKNLRSSKRGVAGGPSGMTSDHLRPLLNDFQSMKLFFQLGENLSRGHVPRVAVEMVRAGRMTALRKPDGGVRGIVTGDVVRRLVARTMSQQLGPATMAATAPHQFALSTRAGCECVAHMLQGVTELNPGITVTSIDGVSAFDMISRRAMIDGLRQVEGGPATLPFVRMFYGTPSEYLWEDSDGEVHSFPQGEGGEQGDPMMPLLFSVGQHHALEVVSRSLREGEKVMAFLDDIYFCSEPNRVGGVYVAIEDALQNHAGISIHGGKTKVWNASGVRPPACDALEEIARIANPTARVWRGSGVPTEQQGMKILGTPLGHPDYVRRHLGELAEEQRLLLERIPRVKDVQGAWLLLAHCASARANYFLRSVRPEAVAEYARVHDAGLWECLSRILQVDLSTCGQETHDVATLPLVLGGLGLRSAERTKVSAYWASWADCMPMIRERHPQVAEQFAASLEGHPDTPYLSEAAVAARSLRGVMGFEPPSWAALATGARPEAREPEEYEPGSVRAGWQHEAASRVERHFRDHQVFPQMEDPRKALVRSQGGPGAGLPFTC